MKQYTRRNSLETQIRILFLKFTPRSQLALSFDKKEQYKHRMSQNAFSRCSPPYHHRKVFRWLQPSLQLLPSKLGPYAGQRWACLLQFLHFLHQEHQRSSGGFFLFFITKSESMISIKRRAGPLFYSFAIQWRETCNLLICLLRSWRRGPGHVAFWVPERILRLNRPPKYRLTYFFPIYRGGQCQTEK